MAKDLKALLAICTGINAVRKPDALQYKLLESIFEVIPADAGAVLLLSEGSSDEFASTIGWSRRSRTNDVVQVGRSVVQKVAKDRTALMSNDVCEEDSSGNESLALRHVQSVLAVPVLSVGRMLGVIYLEALEQDARFDSDHLQFMMAVAAIARAAILGRRPSHKSQQNDASNNASQAPRDCVSTRVVVVKRSRTACNTRFARRLNVSAS